MWLCICHKKFYDAFSFTSGNFEIFHTCDVIINLYKINLSDPLKVLLNSNLVSILYHYIDAIFFDYGYINSFGYVSFQSSTMMGGLNSIFRLRYTYICLLFRCSSYISCHSHFFSRKPPAFDVVTALVGLSVM